MRNIERSVPLGSRSIGEISMVIRVIDPAGNARISSHTGVEIL